MNSIAILGGVFVISIISYTLKDQLGGVYPLLITAAVCVFGAYAITSFLPLLEELSAVVAYSEEAGVVISVVIRVFLVSVAVEVLGSICFDLGMTSYKTLITVFGNFAIVAIMLPTITKVLSDIVRYIHSV